MIIYGVHVWRKRHFLCFSGVTTLTILVSVSIQVHTQTETILVQNSQDTQNAFSVSFQNISCSNTFSVCRLICKLITHRLLITKTDTKYTSQHDRYYV
jgi:hypothetical protein